MSEVSANAGQTVGEGAGPVGAPDARAKALGGTVTRGAAAGLALGVAVLVGGAALWQDRAGQDEAQRMLAEVNQRFAPQRAAWRARQDARMRGELSPLARVDYVHLTAVKGWPQAEAVVGSAEGVPVPAEALAGYGGRAVLALAPGPGGQGQALWVRADRPVTVRRSARARPVGKKLVMEKEQKQEETAAALPLANGDVVVLGRARLLLAGLPADPSVAVYDQGAATLATYAAQGLQYYPDDPRFLALARLERYAAPRAVKVESSRGGPQDQLAVGLLRFELLGAPCSLEAYAEGDDAGHLFLVFRDQSSSGPSAQSYGAGRFLSAVVLPGDQVVLDFNQAWNPLCAYSKYFHCPMPPRQNHLPLAILAGEKAYPHPGGGH